LVLQPSIFSASYIDFEIGKGKLNSNNIRFLTTQCIESLMLSMSLALLATNVGLMWVAVEIATLSTVLDGGDLSQQ